MTNQKCKMKLSEYLCWNNCRIVWLGFRSIWERRLVDTTRSAIWCGNLVVANAVLLMPVSNSVREAVGSYALFDCLSTKRRSDLSLLAIGR